MGTSKRANTELSWADRLTAENTKALENKPDGVGWLTMVEIIEVSNFGVVKTRQIVKDALKAGKMEMFVGTMMGLHGRCTKMIWYRWV